MDISTNRPGAGITRLADSKLPGQRCRDLLSGRRRILSYGVSLEIPANWLAGLNQGEVFGLQPMDPGETARIYVQKVCANAVDLMHSADSKLQLDGLQLLPDSEFLVTGSAVSVHFQVLPAQHYDRAFACWTPVPQKACLMCLALKAGNLELATKAVVQGMIASVQF